ncbi:hypothetical protein [Nostoc sp. 'Peltigera membranacea cyanobiont' 232]|uniref:hypothetical protein n=1 Tax=Nostoc sp. 'Peltigera membranacea cyanobiont' 232 TaxID=2014531 RepID=UPI000B95B5B3|nr:hypothetical protein [Nostoc sp. 'Peltigera membranacea cyanobiont' 232]OYE05270.1 hypothetical protein CDG79_08590 [Nostoc sp. 'Peltigera membranacea cyanobiont' 232]
MSYLVDTNILLRLVQKNSPMHFDTQETRGIIRANASKLLLITTKVKNQRKNQDFAFDYFLSPKAIA